MTDKLLPEDRNAERYVLAACLNMEQGLHIAMQYLKPEDFSFLAHKKMFECMMELSCDETPIDVISVSEKLKADIDNLSDIESIITILDNLPYYCKLVKGKSSLRDLIHKLRDRAVEAYDSDDPSKLISELQNDIYSIGADLEIVTKVKDIFLPHECAEIAFEICDRRIQNPQVLPGIKTGFEKLDSALLGLRDLTIISGSTGRGKTCLALNMAKNIAIIQKIPTLYLNYEMNIEDVSIRMLGILSNVPTHNLATGTYNNPSEDFAMVGDAADLLSNSKLSISGNKSKDIYQTIALISKLHKEADIKVVFIDYIGEIALDNKSFEERAEHITLGRWMQTLKNTCSDMGIKCVVVAQLNRAGEKDAKKENVGGSWKMPQKCDAFLAIDFDLVRSEEDGRELRSYYIYLDKNRHGEGGIKIPIYFNRRTQKIVEI